MTKIIFATGNKDKLREIKEILSDCDVDIRSMKEAGINVDIVEDGKTFEDNALIKARAIAAHTDAIVLADDSGLEIDYLNKEPGVYSARYMGEDTSYDIKNNNLIERLDGVPKEKRTARFVCAIAAVLPDGKELVTRQTMEGYIAEECNKPSRQGSSCHERDACEGDLEYRRSIATYTDKMPAGKLF